MSCSVSSKCRNNCDCYPVPRVLQGRYEKRNVPQQHALDFKAGVSHHTRDLACSRKARQIVEMQMRANVKLQPLLCTSEHLCYAHRSSSARSLANCQSPHAKPWDESLVKPPARDIRSVSAAILPNTCCWERSKHKRSGPHPMPGRCKAHSTAKVHAPSIPSTATVFAHGASVSTHFLAICSPTSAKTARDYKSTFDVFLAVKLASVKSL